MTFINTKIIFETCHTQFQSLIYPILWVFHIHNDNPKPLCYVLSCDFMYFYFCIQSLLA